MTNDLTARVAALEAAVGQLRWQVGQLALLTEPVHHRPGTADAGIWLSVVQNNEYRLPPQFAPGDAVVDVGAHIGGFTFACLSRGAGRAWAFECAPANHAPANHALAVTNLSRFGPRARVERKAVWRSDGAGAAPRFAPDADPARTGSGGLVAAAGAVEVAAVALDDVLAEAAGPSGRVRLLKLDCEGSEYPILFTSRRLGLVDAVCGEYHEFPAPPPPAARVDGFPRCDGPALRDHLTAAGFEVELVPLRAAPGVVHPSDPPLGHFFARRVRPG